MPPSAASVVSCQSPVVDADLDLGDAAVLRPRDAGDDRLVLGQGAQALGDVDPALGEHGGVGGPVPRGPVGGAGGVGGELDPLQPLGRRHEAEQARHEHAGGVAALVGERLAVQTDDDHRVPAVADRLEGRRAGVPGVSGVGVDLLHPGPHADELDEGGERHAQPAAGADVGPADLVRDAGQGDVPLHHRQGQQVVVGQRHRLVDHAVDGERPGRRVDPGGDQADVDPVEVLGRGRERGHARQLDALRQRGGG